MEDMGNGTLLDADGIGIRLVPPASAEQLLAFMQHAGYVEYDGKTFYPTIHLMQYIAAVYVTKDTLYFSPDLVDILQDRIDPETGAWY